MQGYANALTPVGTLNQYSDIIIIRIKRVLRRTRHIMIIRRLTFERLAIRLYCAEPII